MREKDRTLHAEITIDVPPESVLRLWKEPEVFPEILAQIDLVERLDERRSRWQATAPGGKRVEWIAETTMLSENEIRWQSLEGGKTDHVGTIRFAPLDGGSSTRAAVDLVYKGNLGFLGATMFRALRSQIEAEVSNGLVRIKEYLEAGPRPDGGPRPKAQGD